MSNKIRTVDQILATPPTAKEFELKEKHYATLHKRGVTHDEFYVMARFVHALLQVVVPKYGIPLLLELGTREMRLPTWRKTGAGWHLAGHEIVSGEAYGLPVPMMRAISRKLNIGENLILRALYDLSMISVSILTVNIRYRQNLSGRLINPVDGTLLNYEPVKGMTGFVLDRTRIDEWIQKELKKRAAKDPGHNA